MIILDIGMRTPYMSSFGVFRGIAEQECVVTISFYKENEISESIVSKLPTGSFSRGHCRLGLLEAEGNTAVRTTYGVVSPKSVPAD